MTAKRFTLNIDGETINEGDNRYCGEEVVKLLNELHEENQRLQEENIQLKNEFQFRNCVGKSAQILTRSDSIVKENTNRLTQIFEDIKTINSLKEDLRNIRKAQFEDVKEFEKLYKENDELKEEIITLRYRLSSYETE